MKKSFLLLLVTLLLVCAPSFKHKSMLSHHDSLYPLFNNDPQVLKASGDVSICIDREKHQGKITTQYRNKQVKSRIYTPFGQLIASFDLTGDSAEITVGTQTYTASKFDTIQSIQFFSIFSLRYVELARILTGRPFYWHVLSSNRGTVQQDMRNLSPMTWQSDSVEIAVVYNFRRKKVESISYASLNQDRWQLQFSKVKNNCAKEMYFETGEGNYFSIKYRKVMAE